MLATGRRALFWTCYHRPSDLALSHCGYKKQGATVATRKGPLLQKLCRILFSLLGTRGITEGATPSQGRTEAPGINQASFYWEALGKIFNRSMASPSSETENDSTCL